jgi:hypothetical protein
VIIAENLISWLLFLLTFSTSPSSVAHDIALLKSPLIVSEHHDK